jgi:hypothetical protein
MNFSRAQLYVLFLVLLVNFVVSKVGVAQEVNFSGFTTIGLTYSHGDELSFRSSLINQGREGFSFAPDSILGLQANIRFTENLEAVGQVIVQDRKDKSANNLIERAFLRYQINRNWSAEVGRFSTNSYLYTDYRYVGHLLTWARPPIEVYSSAGSLGNVDGLRATYTHDVDFGAIKYAVSFGESKLRNGRLGVDYTDLTVFNVELQATNWRVHAAFLSAKLDDIFFDEIDELNSLDKVLPPIFTPFAHQVQYVLNPNGRRVTYASLGAQYSFGEAELIAELADYDSDWGASLGARSGYATASYRLDSLTPYITFAFYNRSEKPELFDYDAAQAALPAAYFEQLLILTAKPYESVRSSAIDQNSVSMGLRWDFSDTWSLKMQFDHFRVDGYGSGLFSELTDLAPSEKLSYNVSSIVLTTIF